MSSAFNFRELDSIVKRLDRGPSLRKHDARVHKIMAKRYLASTTALANKYKAVTRKSLPGNCNRCSKLTQDLIARFPTARTRQEKLKILTCITENLSIPTVRRLFNCKKNLAEHASALKNRHGAFYAPDVQVPKPTLLPEVKTAVKLFYVTDGNSRVLPGERNAIMAEDIYGVKQRMSKRLILMSLKELYTEFKSLNPEDEDWNDELFETQTQVLHLARN